MNKVSRLLGSAALATCLAIGGTAGAASANDYRDNDNKSHSKHDNNKRYDNNHRGDGRNSGYNHNDRRFLVICFDKWGHSWKDWGDRDDYRKNCFVLYPLVRRY